MMSLVPLSPRVGITQDNHPGTQQHLAAGLPHTHSVKQVNSVYQN